MAQDPGTYDERLRVPLRWWALATMFWASVLLAFLVAVPAPVALLVFGVLAALNVAVFATYGSARIMVGGGVLRAGRAQIELQLLEDPRPLDSGETKRAAGVEADARAYLLLRPYLSRSVLVTVVDPADPTPYWLVCTRHPHRLAAELSTAIRASVRA